MYPTPIHLCHHLLFYSKPNPSSHLAWRNRRSKTISEPRIFTIIYWKFQGSSSALRAVHVAYHKSQEASALQLTGVCRACGPFVPFVSYVSSVSTDAINSELVPPVIRSSRCTMDVTVLRSWLEEPEVPKLYYPMPNHPLTLAQRIRNFSYVFIT